jgi:pyruvate/2-oxoglutarate dehydrogenase complex dihydrolipoamide dehydrogenase (E3) component
VGVPFDELLCALGRTPRVTGFGLEALGIALTPQGTVQTDAFLRTRHPNIFAVGDVAGPLQLTHAAAHQAWHAVVNALFGRFRRFRVDLRFIPSAVFTDPEVARVGLTEEQAREQGLAFEVTHFPLDDLDRAIAEGAAVGFVKVLTQAGRDRVIGVTVVGEHAGELIAPWALAMRHGLGLNRVLATTLPYPTMAESAKLAAGQWKRAHAPQRLLRWAQQYHHWSLK